MGKKGKTKYLLFASTLEKKYKAWKKANHGSMEIFADLVGLSDRASISKYINAEQYPSKETMERICEALNTTEEELNSGSIADRYRLDENFTSELHKGYKLFCESIGLDENFLSFIRHEISDAEFPLFKRIVYQPKDMQFVYTNELEAFSSGDHNIYQLDLGNGKTVNLSYPDFVYLKDIQNEIADYIRYLFYKRHKEMEDELQHVNADLIKENGDQISVAVPGFRKLCDYNKYLEYIDSGKIESVLKEGKRNGKKD